MDYKNKEAMIRHCESLTTDALVAFAKELNLAYRSGNPVTTDSIYDHVVIAEISARDPNHPFLLEVEPEPEDDTIDGKMITLPTRMLSTDKSFTMDTTQRWAKRVLSAARDLGIDESLIELRVTPKLDGFAAYDDGATLYTRGNGYRGRDITHAVNNGLQTFGETSRGLGAGEIVVDIHYFEKFLAGQFANTRNVISSVLREEPIEEIKNAMKNKGVVFFPFEALPSQTLSIDALFASYQEIIDSAHTSTNFDVDGVIVEVVNDDIKTHMGQTNKAHRWMIALKENKEVATSTVVDVIPQTSRAGIVTPVILIEPTEISGVTVSRATGHNYKLIKERLIGQGAVIEIVRAGLVIPKVVNTIKPTQPLIATHCPSCHEALEWGNELDGNASHLVCTNQLYCLAQAAGRLQHWFDTLGNVDGFGDVTVDTLANNDIASVSHIYNMNSQDFEALGFGKKSSQNLVNEIRRSRTEAIEDWRFLAAFGIQGLGLGTSEKILQHIPLTDLFDASYDDLIAIKSVGVVTAKNVIEGLHAIKDEFNKLHTLGFNLTKTVPHNESVINDNPIKNKQIVFTGTMSAAPRSELQKQAKAMGAKVGSKVSSKTDFLVIGEKAGSNKLNDAKAHNTHVLSEQEYLSLIGDKNE